MYRDTNLRSNPCHLLQSCGLYRNTKDAPIFLFVGASALYSLTGSAMYHAEADAMWPMFDAVYRIYLYNWNNVVTQGLVIMSMSADLPAAQNSRDFYRGFLRTAVDMWAQCSNTGEFRMKDKQFCECALLPPRRLRAASFPAPSSVGSTARSPLRMMCLQLSRVCNAPGALSG